MASGTSSGLATASSISGGTVYFGFGSNLWVHQMATRCPQSEYLGIAKLPGYRWIINDRGYANVVSVQTTSEGSNETPAETSHNSDDHVWGMMFRLQNEDEKRLDRNEGVPYAYQKEMHPVEFWPSKSQSKAPFNGWDSVKVDIGLQPEPVEALVYIDRERTKPDKPKQEYIFRMNRGIEDALKAGIPTNYISAVMRPFIPESEESEEIRKVAAKQAENFEDEE